MIFDLRIYTLQNSKLAAWLKLYAEHGHPPQVKHCGEPVFYATTEVGTLNQVVHVWKCASQADRERKRDALMADPAFQAYLQKSRELGAHQHQECRILKSTSFSPL
ncbi:MAG: NIPSNAP family protein [Burkholderiales bacterium]